MLGEEIKRWGGPGLGASTEKNLNACRSCTLRNCGSGLAILAGYDKCLWLDARSFFGFVAATVEGMLEWDNFGRLNTSHAAVFWISYKGWIARRGRPARVICSSPVSRLNKHSSHFCEDKWPNPLDVVTTRICTMNWLILDYTVLLLYHTLQCKSSVVLFNIQLYKNVCPMHLRYKII